MAQKTFTFSALPHTLEELQALPEAALTDPFAVAALDILALCEYKNSPEQCIAMLNYLKGPQPVSPFEEQFLRDRLGYGASYIPYSYFAGATPENAYTPVLPYTLTISDNPYSYQEENYATLFAVSNGADSPREIKLRRKPSTGQWFEWGQMLLGSIRIPKEEDPWA